MSDPVEKETLLKLLIDDRNYHYNHMHETNVKFWYTFGGTLTTIFLALAFRDKITSLDNLMRSHGQYYPYYFISLVLIGYIFIIWGLFQHAENHKQHTRRLEQAIDYILDPEHEFTYMLFWEKFGKKTVLRDYKNKAHLSLLILEPDVRKGFRFHDAKVFVGILIILLTVLTLLFSLV